MASFCNVSIIALFLLACGVFLSTPAQAFDTSEQHFGFALEGSSSIQETIIEPADKLLHRLDTCLKKVGDKCGALFFNRIFIGKKDGIPASCCEALVDAGKECHDTITGAVLSRAEFNGNTNLYQRRAVNTWNMCSD